MAICEGFSFVIKILKIFLYYTISFVRRMFVCLKFGIQVICMYLYVWIVRVLFTEQSYLSRCERKWLKFVKNIHNTHILSCRNVLLCGKCYKHACYHFNFYWLLFLTIEVFPKFGRMNISSFFKTIFFFYPFGNFTLFSSNKWASRSEF